MKKLIKLLSLVIILALGIALLTACGEDDSSNTVVKDPSRSFKMGIGIHPFSSELQYEAAPLTFSSANSDILQIKFDQGIPWQQLLGSPINLPANVNAEIVRLKTFVNSHPSKDVVLIVNPFNADYTSYAGGYKGATNTLPQSIVDNKFAAPLLRTAYRSFLNILIAELSPDYLVYAENANLYYNNSSISEFNRFIDFAEEIYSLVKLDNPSLQLSVSYQVDEYKDDIVERHHMACLMPYNDIIALSSFPYLKGETTSNFTPLMNLAKSKPVAIVDTGYSATNYKLMDVEESEVDGVITYKAVNGMDIVGSETLQLNYMKYIVDFAEKGNVLFVIWSIGQDYDMLTNEMIALHGAVNLAGFNKYQKNGLLNGVGNQRPALSYYREVFAWDFK